MILAMISMPFMNIQLQLSLLITHSLTHSLAVGVCETCDCCDDDDDYDVSINEYLIAVDIIEELITSRGFIRREFL